MVCQLNLDGRNKGPHVWARCMGTYGSSRRTQRTIVPIHEVHVTQSIIVCKRNIYMYKFRCKNAGASDHVCNGFPSLWCFAGFSTSWQGSWIMSISGRKQMQPSLSHWKACDPMHSSWAWEVAGFPLTRANGAFHRILQQWLEVHAAW